jgi:hypothetical protein
MNAATPSGTAIKITRQILFGEIEGKSQAPQSWRKPGG